MDGKEEEKNDIQKNKLKWTEQVENIFISWADKAIVYKILHERAYKKNKLKNYAFTIPCVVLSTILASATFALSGDSNTIPKEYATYAQYSLGGVNIFIGILQTLQNFFKYAQMSEAHDSVSKQWYKLYRVINTELNIARNKRRDADEFMKFARMEFDRLIELSPDIPDNIVKAFKEGYIKKTDYELVEESNKKEKTADNNALELPDICGTISHTRAYRFDDIEEEEKKEDPFDELVKRINNNMNAASIYLGNKNRPETPGVSTNVPYNISSSLVFEKPGSKQQTPVNNADSIIQISNNTPTNQTDNSYIRSVIRNTPTKSLTASNTPVIQMNNSTPKSLTASNTPVNNTDAVVQINDNIPTPVNNTDAVVQINDNTVVISSDMDLNNMC